MTITVWVVEHDDPDVEFVVNSRDDMADNFRDLGYGDPADNPEEFRNYCDTWTELEMPEEIFYSGDHDREREWVRANV